MKLVVSVMLASFQLIAQANGKEHLMKYPTLYRTIEIDGLSIFYREAGRRDAPTILLLHGLPSRGVPTRIHDGHRARGIWHPTRGGDI